MNRQDQLRYPGQVGSLLAQTGALPTCVLRTLSRQVEIMDLDKRWKQPKQQLPYPQVELQAQINRLDQHRLEEVVFSDLPKFRHSPSQQEHQEQLQAHH